MLISLSDGGCILNNQVDNCGLTVGQTTTQFIATFANGDRANLRRSENLEVSISSSIVGLEKNGILKVLLQRLKLELTRSLQHI